MQGVEQYKGKLIIYGCGDFVDDYAVTPGYRNDLSAIWQLTVSEAQDANDSADSDNTCSIKLKSLEIHPTIIERFQARRLQPKERDNVWVCQKIKELSHELGTEIFLDKDRGTAVLDLN